VIVDVEGAGYLNVLTAVPPLMHVRGEETLLRFEASFENGSIVLALDEGDVDVQVVLGRTCPVEGDAFLTCGEFNGSGWIISASESLVVDERHEDAPKPSQGFAIPFFRSVRSRGSVGIVSVPTITCERVDFFSIDDEVALKSRGFKVQNLSAVFSLESCFADKTTHVGPVASHLNAASFWCLIPEGNIGLSLRKTYDRFHGRQRARVFVDQEFAGWWYEPSEDRTNRWHISDFGIDSNLTKGKSRILITIEPPAGVPLWSVSSLEVFALRPVPT